MWPKHLPFSVTERIAQPFQVGSQTIAGEFGLFNRMRVLMSTPGRKEELIDLLHDDNIVVRTRLVALFAHMADAMTLQSPETVEAIPYGNLTTVDNGHEQMFPHPKNWSGQRKVMAESISAILCNMADVFGMSYVYRRLRDISAEELHPDEFKEAVEALADMRVAITNTNLLIENILMKLEEACNGKLQFEVIRRHVDPARKAEDYSEEHKSAGSLAHKLVKKRKKTPEIVARDVHDIAARIILVNNINDLYEVKKLLVPIMCRQLNELGIGLAVRMKNQNDELEENVSTSMPQNAFLVIEDCIQNPREQNPNYGSLHMDVILGKMFATLVNFEFILRTREMHEECDCGGLAHGSVYKDGVLSNGLSRAFKRALEEARGNSNGNGAKHH